RVVPEEKPAILAILAEESRFHLPESFTLRTAPALIHESLHIVWMHNPRDDVLRPHRPQLFRAQTAVLQHYVIRIPKTPSRFQGGEHALRNKIDELPQLPLLLADLLFCFPHLGIQEGISQRDGGLRG